MRILSSDYRLQLQWNSQAIICSFNEFMAVFIVKFEKAGCNCGMLYQKEFVIEE